ncbi:MAG TPA: hypothetical protein PLM56_12935 [Cyclobacteriaceae bacterium]|nr:hypothetical protein [Cyclobacteriaceae bacterium]HRF34402.1 hypothetical protein [Cyclobacteriaceae bacterium]
MSVTSARNLVSVFIFTTLLFAGAGFYTTHAQDKQVTISTLKHEAISDYIFLGEAGFILSITQLEVGIYMEHTLSYFTPELELLWKKEFKDKQQYANRDKHLMASPTGSYTYYLEIASPAGSGFNKKTHDILQIKKDGTEKRMELEPSEAFGQSLQTIFCDEQHLYYLATENGNERHNKKKTTEKLILNRFDHEQLKPERFLIDLPAIAEGENTTFWQYVANTETEILLVSKAMDIPLGKAIYDVATVSTTGKVLSVKRMPVNLHQKFTRPANDIAPAGSRYVMATDLSSSSTTHTLNGSSQTITIVTAGGYGNLAFDPATNGFYVYGLLGPIPFRKVSPLYEGFYLIHLDKEGNEQWRVQHTGPEELVNNGVFRKHGRPADRWISLSFLPNQHLNFVIGFGATVVEYDVSARGTVAGHKMWRDIKNVGSRSNWEAFPFSAAGEFKSYDFVHKLLAEKKPATGFLGTAFTSGEVIIENSERDNHIKLYYFNRTP